MNASAKTYQILYKAYEGTRAPHSRSAAFSGVDEDPELIYLYNSNFLVYQLTAFSIDRATEGAYEVIEHER